MSDSKPNSTKQQVVGGFFWMLSSAFTQMVVRLLTLAVLARFLTPNEFGVVAAATVILGFAEIVTQLGIGPALVQRSILESRHLRTAFTILVLLIGTVAALLFTSAAFFAEVFHAVEIINLLRALLVVFVLDNLAIIPMSLIQRELGFRPLATISITGTLSHAGVAIGMAVAGCGVWALVGGQLGQAVVKAALLFTKKRIDIRPLVDRQAVLDMLHFNGGYFLTRLANKTALQGDYLVVGHFLGTAPLGVYTRAYQLMGVPAQLLGSVLDVILFPVLARVQDRQHQLAAAYRRAATAVALVTLPSSAVLVILAPELVDVLLGSQWHDVILPLQILAGGLFFRMSYRVSDALARGTGAVFSQALYKAVYAALVLLGAGIGQFWGLAGVAAGVILALAINFMLMASLSVRLSGLPWRAFWSAHVHGVLLTPLAAAQALLVGLPLRDTGLPALAVLAVVFATLTTSAVLLLYTSPRPLLGADGLWIIETLVSYLRRRMPRAHGLLPRTRKLESPMPDAP